jgi:hypothetical protein
VSEAFENPNDVTKQHNYALYVLFGAVYKILASYVQRYVKDKATPDPRRLQKTIQDLTGYYQTAVQLDMRSIHRSLMDDVEELILKLSGTKAKRGPKNSKELPNKTHVDDWIDAVFRNDSAEVRYAKFYFRMHRWPAIDQMYFQELIDQFKLFATYEGKRWRVTGCSRMGDIWLSESFDRLHGYEKRVYIDDCSDWSRTP